MEDKTCECECKNSELDCCKEKTCECCKETCCCKAE